MTTAFRRRRRSSRSARRRVSPRRARRPTARSAVPAWHGRSRTSFCTRRAPRRSNKRNGSPRASTSSRSPKPTRRARVRPDAKLGHRRHVSRRGIGGSRSCWRSPSSRSSCRSTRRTRAPTTRSTSWDWRTSGRCERRSATRPRRATRVREFETFIVRYPNSELMPEVEDRLREAQGSTERGGVRGRPLLLPASMVSGRHRSADGAAEGGPGVTPARDAVYFYLAESLIKVNREAEALPLLREARRRIRAERVPATMRSKRIDELKSAAGGEAPRRRQRRRQPRPVRTAATLRSLLSARPAIRNRRQPRD